MIPLILNLSLHRPWKQFSPKNLMILLLLLAQLIQTIPRPLLPNISYFPLPLDLFHAFPLLQAQERILEDKILFIPINSNMPFIFKISKVKQSQRLCQPLLSQNQIPWCLAWSLLNNGYNNIAIHHITLIRDKNWIHYCPLHPSSPLPTIYSHLSVSGNWYCYYIYLYIRMKFRIPGIPWGQAPGVPFPRTCRERDSLGPGPMECLPVLEGYNYEGRDSLGPENYILYLSKYISKSEGISWGFKL